MCADLSCRGRDPVAKHKMPVPEVSCHCDHGCRDELSGQVPHMGLLHEEVDEGRVESKVEKDDDEIPGKLRMHVIYGVVMKGPEFLHGKRDDDRHRKRQHRRFQIMYVTELHKDKQRGKIARRRHGTRSEVADNLECAYAEERFERAIEFLQPRHAAILSVMRKRWYAPWDRRCRNMLHASGLSRESTEAPLSRVFIPWGIVGRMFARMRTLSLEDAAVWLFGASFFIGIWYALPMVNTITDVWPFGGGVLRAMEAHTLLPGYGVNYGTLSFYLNYAFMTLALAAGYVFSGFDFEALKTVLILNPSYSLLVPRLVSALTAGVFLLFVHRFLKAHVHSVWWRLALLVLVFGNVLAVLLARSGKMWMLSIALGTVSFIYLYRSLREEASGGRPSRLAFTSVITAFLATANFPFAAVYLVNIPVLLFAFPRTYDSLKPLAYAVALGGALLIGVFALNAGNTIAQVSGFILPLVGIGVESAAAARLTYFESFIVNARQAIEAFPLLLLALVAVARS